MASLNACWILLTVVSLQGILVAQAKPVFGGGCGEIDYGCGGYGGGFGGFGERFCGGYGGGFGEGFGRGPIIAPTPPISFLPVPQPLPVRVPVPPRQSVTIPNIILALLPPNNKPPCLPKPIVRPPHFVVPLPQPCPVPIPTPCGC
ncbi:cuticle protein 79-like [Planococcus citri]|uniref:cuticle protein 79-like n=1 Tax=Planococcus citri TaxID=170843 RepID=UPI0031F876E2